MSDKAEKKSGTGRNFSVGGQGFISGDISQQRIYNISQTGSIVGGTVNFSQVAGDSIKLDGETANLLDWLAAQQGVSREIALKKALATAAYIYDLKNQGEKLLVQREDNSVGEILLR